MFWEHRAYNFGKNFAFSQTSFKHSYLLSNNLKSSISGNVLSCILWNHFYSNSTLKATIKYRYLFKKIRKENSNEKTIKSKQSIKNRRKKRRKSNHKKSHRTKEIYPMVGVLGCRMLRWPLNAGNENLKTEIVIHLGLYKYSSYSFKFHKAHKGFVKLLFSFSHSKSRVMTFSHFLWPKGVL